jgi:hypothetical protein
MKMKYLIISFLLFAQNLGCKTGDTSISQNQTQEINNNQNQCVLEEFLNCPKEEVRQFCQSDPETLVGFRSPTCLECPEMVQCLT